MGKKGGSKSGSKKGSKKAKGSAASTIIINGDEIDLTLSPYYDVYTHPSIVFANTEVLDGVNYVDNDEPAGVGWKTGIVSPRNVLYNAIIDTVPSMNCPNGSFDVRSLYMASVYAPNLDVTLNGYSQGTLVASVTLPLVPIVKQFLVPTLSSIDSLEFVTPPSSGLSNNPYFVMDDLVIDIVRECTM